MDFFFRSVTGNRKTEDIILKDLKHLKYFEDLLQEANNDLIR